MALPDSWTNKPNAIADYLEAIKQAQAPERFSSKFLEGLGFKSTNDRKFIGILKDLGFLDADGKPTARYFQYLDLSRSEEVLATAIREEFADLFAINKEAQKLTPDQVKNKLRTLYAGSKKDSVIALIANTFCALAKSADFEMQGALAAAPPSKDDKPSGGKGDAPPKVERHVPSPSHASKLAVTGLQYHVNIVLPESRDQAVYDALFRALREHLG
jgi:hypothetical protein